MAQRRAPDTLAAHVNRRRPKQPAVVDAQADLEARLGFYVHVPGLGPLEKPDVFDCLEELARLAKSQEGESAAQAHRRRGLERLAALPIDVNAPEPQSAKSRKRDEPPPDAFELARRRRLLRENEEALRSMGLLAE